MRYLIYTRKSTSDKDERQVQSIEDQQRHARKLAVDGGLYVLEEISEARSAKEPYKKLSRGGKVPAREGFARMISMIEDGEIDGIIAWHPDRLSRNEIDAAAITHLLRTGKLKDLQFCQYTFSNSPEGIMMLQMALSQSQYYSSKLGKDVQRGMHTKAEKGWFPHHAPPGYINNKHMLKGQKTISPDPDRFQTLRQAWDMALSGTTSVVEVKRALNVDWGYRSQHGRPMAKSTLHEMFSNVFYAGYFVQKGQLYKGNHEPMVTMDEYRKVQAILHTRMTTRPRVRKFAYTGMIRCAICKGQVTAYVTPKPSGRTYTYYRCANLRGDCANRNVPLPIIEEQVEQVLSRITIQPVFQEWAWEAYREWENAARSARQETSGRNERSVAEVEWNLNSLLSLKIKELITDTEYTTRKRELQIEREALAELQTDIESTVARARESMENQLSFMLNVSDWFHHGAPDTKRAILHGLASNCRLNHKKLLLELHPLLKPVEVSYKDLEGKYREIGLMESSSESSKEELLQPIRSTWSRIWDQNLTRIAEEQLYFPRLEFPDSLEDLNHNLLAG